jgi:hypothetical protein
VGLPRTAWGCCFGERPGAGWAQAGAGVPAGLGGVGRLALKRGRDFDGGHAGGRRCLDAEIGVFKDEAVLRRDAEPVRGEQEGVRRGFGVLVLFRADDGLEAVKQADGGEGLDDRLAGAAGDDGQRQQAVLGVNVLENLRNGLEFGQQLVVKILFADAERTDGHVEAVHGVEGRDDGVHGHAGPGVEERLVEGAAPLGERGLPGDVMQRHGVDDGAVAVKEIGFEVAVGNGQFEECGGLIFHAVAARDSAGAAQPPSPGLVGSIWSALLKRLK